MQGPDVLKASFLCCCSHCQTFAGGVGEWGGAGAFLLLWDLPSMAVFLQDYTALCILAEAAQHPVAVGHFILRSS